MSDDSENWVGSGWSDCDATDKEQRQPSATRKMEKGSYDGTDCVAKGNNRVDYARGKPDAPAQTSQSSMSKPKEEKQHDLMTGRTSELADKMLPLRNIKPVLSSRHLVKGWLDRGALSVIYGESNVGKTFFAIDLAFHVAAGKDWHGYKVPNNLMQTGSVVYVACEGGLSLNNRVEAMRQHDPALVAAAEPNFFLLPTILDLCGCNDAPALIGAVENRCNDPSLIIIDTLAMAFGSGDENTAKDMGLFIANCTRLRIETGAHVMVIHHSGKDSSKGARGSGSLRAAADSEIELKGSGDVIMARDRKQRDKPKGNVFAYKLQSVFLGKDEDGDAVTSAVVEVTEPVKKSPHLKGQALIAKQAFDEALTNHARFGREKASLMTVIAYLLISGADIAISRVLAMAKVTVQRALLFNVPKRRCKRKRFSVSMEALHGRAPTNSPSQTDTSRHKSRTVPDLPNVTYVTHSYRSVTTVTEIYSALNLP